MSAAIASHTRAAIKEARTVARAAAKEARAAAKAAEKAAHSARIAEATARAKALVSVLPFVNTAFRRAGEGETPPPMSVYALPADSIVAHRCQGRRTDSDHCDRRWKPFVFAAIQCKNYPIDGSDLCETCLGHEAEPTKGHWNGRVTGPLPATSQIGGSEKSTRAVWLDAERPKTRRQVERAEKRRLIADVELRHFADGTIDLPIEDLAIRDNQISTQQLRDVACLLMGIETGATGIRGCGTRTDLCKLIRSLKAGDPQIVVVKNGPTGATIVSFPSFRATTAVYTPPAAPLDPEIEAAILAEEEFEAEMEDELLASAMSEEAEDEDEEAVLVVEETNTIPDDMSSIPEVVSEADSYELSSRAGEAEVVSEAGSYELASPAGEAEVVSEAGEDEVTTLRLNLAAREAEIAALREQLAAIRALVA